MASPPQSTARKWMKNMALLFGAIFFSYILLEVVFVYWIIPSLSLERQSILPRGIQPLAQSSKKGLVPENYIGIVGDSYAAGAGDWLFEAIAAGGNKPFQSAHIIHEQTGQDVINFGRSGKGSIYTLVVMPRQYYNYIDGSMLLDLDHPETVLVYFYEGNDLNNNFERLKPFISKDGKVDLEQLDHSDVFAEYLYNPKLFAPNLVEKIYDKWEKWSSKFMLKDFFQFQTICIMESCISSVEEDQKETKEKPVKDKINRVKIAGKITGIPNNLQGPSMELAPGEVKAAEYVFDRSLAELKKSFTKSKYIVVYLPSPITSYQVVSEQVSLQSYMERGEVFDTNEVMQRSDQVCELVRKAAEKNGAAFTDARVPLRKAALQNAIHGPKDWKHYNKLGYTVLGTELSAILTGEAELKDCGG